MTSPSNGRADAVQGPWLLAPGPEPSSGVGPALYSYMGAATWVRRVSLA
jgi:hypothetical protein